MIWSKGGETLSHETDPQYVVVQKREADLAIGTRLQSPEMLDERDSSCYML